MSDAKLKQLFDERTRRMNSLTDDIQLGSMSSSARAEADTNAKMFRSLDWWIADELIRRKTPVALGNVTLHLTADRLNFVPLESAEESRTYESILLNYSLAFPDSRRDS